MGIYVRRRADGSLQSPFYWMKFGIHPLTGQSLGKRRPTAVKVEADTPEERRLNKATAEAIYNRAHNAALLDSPEKKALAAKEANVPTFREVAAAYEANCGHSGKVQEINKIKQLVNYRFPSTLLGATICLGDLPVTAVRPGVVKEFRTARLNPKLAASNGYVRHCGPSTVNTIIDVLRMVISSAVAADQLESNPLLRTALPRLNPKDFGGSEFVARVIERDEMDRMCAAVADRIEIESIPRAEGQTLLVFAVETMLRRGSLLRLTWDNFKHTHFIPLNAKVSRKHNPATVTPETHANLARIVRINKFVFGSFWAHGQSLASKDAAEQRLTRWFAEVCRLADVPHGRADNGATFHCLRHTGATWAIENGHDHKSVMEAGGWKNVTLFTNTYVKTDVKRVRAVSEGMFKKKTQVA
jgi:integrase